MLNKTSDDFFLSKGKKKLIDSIPTPILSILSIIFEMMS